MSKIDILRYKKCATLPFDLPSGISRIIGARDFREMMAAGFSPLIIGERLCKEPYILVSGHFAHCAAAIQSSFGFGFRIHSMKEGQHDET
jgi:hypothetical protein